MLPSRTLLLVGATGLVGQEVLSKALHDERVAQVVAPTRRALPPHPRLLNPVFDFETLPLDAPWWTADAVVCALGSTMAKAGSQQAFRKIDFDLPLQIAQLCQARGAQAFALNSALGADAQSRIFYSRVKGELEDAMRALAFPSLTLVRPGLLGGERQEHRSGERMALWISKCLAPLLPRRYRIAPAERVSHYLLQAALEAKPGVHVLMSEELR